MARPQRLNVGHHAQLAEPGNVGGIEKLDMGDLVQTRPRPVGGHRPLHPVQCRAARHVADGMDMNLEARGVEGGEHLVDLSLLEHHRGVAALRIAVGRDHRRRPVLDHAVEEELRRMHPEQPVPAFGAEIAEAFQRAMDVVSSGTTSAVEATRSVISLPRARS